MLIFRALGMAALLAATATVFDVPAKAASLDVAGATTPSGGRASGYWRSRHYVVRAPDELIRGVRGASPLTVPFFGAGWYPGTERYYGPRHSICCVGQDPVVSVRY
jgi:hypothetical protein